MSKAFMRESDDAPDLPLPIRPHSPLPAGTKNYLTPDGAQRLQDELTRLVESERPRLAALPNDSDAKSHLATIDRRIAHLEESLRAAVVVRPPDPPWDHVRFGAIVTFRETDGSEDRFHIVGLDETDFEPNSVSWLSPIAKALLNARLGQRVRFRVPAGERELEIIGITYG